MCALIGGCAVIRSNTVNMFHRLKICETKLIYETILPSLLMETILRHNLLTGLTGLFNNFLSC